MLPYLSTVVSTQSPASKARARALAPIPASHSPAAHPNHRPNDRRTSAPRPPPFGPSMKDSDSGLQLTQSAPDDCPKHNPKLGTDSSITRNYMQKRPLGPNVLILSGAGKPIFVRYGASDCTDLNDATNQIDPDDEVPEKAEEEDWAMACSLLQALRANVMSFGLHGDLENFAAPLGDIQSIKAGKKLIVFMNTEALTLVAISEECGYGYTETEGWLRLQLEYVYAQVIFTLTNQVNTIFRRSPSYDLRTMMGPNVNASLRNLLDRFDPVDSDTCDVFENDSPNSYSSGCGSFLTAAVECISPIPTEIRDEASKILIDACKFGGHHKKRRFSQIQDPLFAILMVGTQLVTLVQPAHPSSQLHTSDLHLILTFVGMQPGLLTNELWFPLCLPRFDSSGFLYAFTSCLEPQGTGLSIVLISPNNSTEQFEAFRYAAMSVRKSLGLPTAKSSVLRIFDSSSSVSSSVATPIAGTRLRPSEDDSTTISGYSEDYDPEKTFDDTAWKREDIEEDNAPAPRARGGHRTYNDRQAQSEKLLINSLKAALSPNQKEEMMAQYLGLASAVHFLFRCDIYINSPNDHVPGGMLSQCFGPKMGFPFVDPTSQRQVWNIYQRLALRLRLGSSSVETTMDAFDMISGHENKNIDSRGISRDCPMQCLMESPPCVHGVTYIQQNNEWLYVGLNGKFFELYATLPGNIGPKTGTAYCARLVRTLMGDERTLFLSNPLTWES